MSALDIEEMNKIRVALGMKPLPVPGMTSSPNFKSPRTSGKSQTEEDEPSTLASREAKAEENWQKLQDEADAKARRATQKEAIRKERDRAYKSTQLEGQGLGDADGDELDTRTWLAKQKKRQKKIEKARKLEEELAEREQANRPEYTAADLAGVKVGHELDKLDVGGEHILTLKDIAVDAEEEDNELEANDIRETEKLAERQESKKRKQAYNPLNEEDNNSSILNHYDEKERKYFALDQKGTASVAQGASTDLHQSKRVRISLDDFEEQPAPSDYLEPQPIKMRKSKKKTKPKTTRKKSSEDDDEVEEQTSIIALAPPAKGMFTEGKVNVGDDNKGAPDNSFIADDEDLQANLAMQRRDALKKRKRVRPEDIARQMKAEALAQSTDTYRHEEESAYPAAADGLVIDETTEFVDRLQRPTLRQARKEVTSNGTAQAASTETDPEQLPDVQNIDEDDLELPDAPSEDGCRDGNMERTAQGPSAIGGITTTGLDTEHTVARGVGATLSLLSQRGIIEKNEGGDLSKSFRERERFLLEKKRREEEAEKRARTQRERDRQSGKFEHMSAREREEHARRTNLQREQGESRDLAELFNQEYKPNVQLTYTDEFGRHIDRAEAFKNLSHQFHGKGSGKHKTEMRLKKIADERRHMASSALDTNQKTGINNVAGVAARKSRQAGVRLQ